MIELYNQVAHSSHCFSLLQGKNSPHAFSPFSRRKECSLVSRKGNIEVRANPKKKQFCSNNTIKYLQF